MVLGHFTSFFVPALTAIVLLHSSAFATNTYILSDGSYRPSEPYCPLDIYMDDPYMIIRGTFGAKSSGCDLEETRTFEPLDINLYKYYHFPNYDLTCSTKIVDKNNFVVICQKLYDGEWRLVYQSAFKKQQH